MRLHKHLLAAATASLFATGAWAAGTDTTTKTTTPPPATPAARADGTPAVPARTPGMTAPADRSAMLKDEKNRLEQILAGANSRADYAKVLESNGYRISAINSDKPDYLEYEVVKGDHSYEVQLDFDKGAKKATKVDVATNLWRADATKKMMQDPNYKHPTAMKADPQGRYSDKRYMKAWTDEKDRLEKALAPNQTVAAYKNKIEQMGYKITAVNDRETDYVEYEILKGDNSYEVQIDIDPQTKMAKKVDVASNVWDADGTERAKDAKDAKVSRAPK
jgi:hypothetical protein